MSKTKTLDEILDYAFKGEIEWVHDELDGTSFVEQSLKHVEDKKQEVKEQLQEIIRTERLKLKFDIVLAAEKHKTTIRREKKGESTFMEVVPLDKIMEILNG